MATTEFLPARRATKPTSSAKKPASLPQETVDYLKAWMMSPEHIAHPYPTEQEKAQIMAETGIELKQLTNWFVNNRKRYWKPRVEAKLTVDEGGRAAPPLAAAFPINIAAQGRAQLVRHPAEDPHTVSEQGSVVSSSSSPSGWCSEEDDSIDPVKQFKTPFQPVSMYRNALMPQHAKEGSVRREVVDVHVLHPEVDGESAGEVLPTLRDVTIKTNVKKEMILATFPKCLLQYSVPEEIENDRKKVQTRRDGEVLRVKKHYLKLYLATRGIHSVSSPCGENPIDVVASCSSSNNSSCNNSVSTASNQDENKEKPIKTTFNTNISKKRSLTSEDMEEPAPRRRRIVSSDAMNGDEEWRAICQNASDIFCDTLPGLEEAAVMFGYVSQ
jgi:hypothetical protein